MSSQHIILRILPVFTILLACVIFIALKLVSRFRSKALGRQNGHNLSIPWSAAKNDTRYVGQIKLKWPALIQKSQDFMKVTIKEISLLGAFVTCPNPLPIGETFSVKIFRENHDPLELNAQVLWNNKSVSDDQIISRGMKVRFMHLSENDRKILQQLVSEPLPQAGIP